MRQSTASASDRQRLLQSQQLRIIYPSHMGGVHLLKLFDISPQHRPPLEVLRFKSSYVYTTLGSMLYILSSGYVGDVTIFS